MVRIIIGAVIGLCAGSVSFAVLVLTKPHAQVVAGLEYWAYTSFVFVTYGGCPAAVLGAVLGASSTIVKAVRDDKRDRRPAFALWRTILGAIAGFVWSVLTFGALFFFSPTARELFLWQNVIFGACIPFATIGATLGATSAVLKALRNSEHERQRRALERSFDPDDLARKYHAGVPEPELRRFDPSGGKLDGELLRRMVE